ncbi:MAG: phenylalanine--tRNA ligase subunit beta [Muribaculaceae bacterium]|nr:phenylalanine--tRNA ligase subunit beta [Muribaculaceae bacterium]
MNISYNWLKQYIDTTLTPDELAAALTSIGLETGSVEKVESIPGGLAGIVIGKVLTCVEHPDSDHLHITTVDLGQSEPAQIVCGAPNVAAGQTVVVATVGTTLYAPDGTSFKIKKSKIRGVESYGMICAEDEIGVGHSHDGIIVLEDGAAAPGTPAADFYGLTDDYVLEVDLTPNRIDAASHYGVARDLAAYLSAHVAHTRAHKPDVSHFCSDRPEADNAVNVELLNPEACLRYSGLTVEGVKVAESPQWLRDRLSAIGLRPINNIVDITNYILHAFCQPLHCFDVDHIAGRTVKVRKATQGAPFTTLDGVERKLDAADLMICDSEKEMCIAGVFGGLDSGVTENTTSIFIESACFHPTSVRKTARRHGLSTDASFRYERGVDPNGCVYALKLAALLVKELAGGTIVGDIVDIYPRPVTDAHVTLSYEDIDRLVGRPLEPEKVDVILRALEMHVKGHTPSGAMELAIPTYRVDVTRPCDVIEDVLRIYGYNNIEISHKLHSSLSYKTATDAADDLRRLIADQLTGAGFSEILNNSLSAEAYYTALDMPELPADHCVHLLNPLSQDLNVMRATLLFGGLETIAHNVNRKTADLGLYEFGNVYSCNPDKQSTLDAPLAPYSESARLALWMTGNITPASWVSKAVESSFFHLRTAVDNILVRLGLDMKRLRYTAFSDKMYATALSVSTHSGELLGTMGIIHPAVAARADIKLTVFYAELDWNRLVRNALKHTVTYSPLPKTQPVKRDLSLLIDNTVTMQQIADTVTAAEKKLLRDVKLFDVYEGDKLPEGKKSYAINITLQDEEKTLNDKQIDNTMNRIVERLRKDLAAELR